ncbi:iron complex outermembrane recepter protein [Chitinophaga terrae (ex Kim and Jung 2007)]|uniref:Iron complex outermembrane recepter protein n=1 Tax=Chitinophaga terrae (ex Kim and Jung 2007) TaxID=408074 RepID=A0A1H4D5A7_9BACT|nr:TonB-dependent receptor [Chitinophaga terrae (ex Kim and Jung 2007)]GEP90556.1 TonB-dependent receptor [Chitinophaga terrae (ex Kim and Jung 2007)]SEA67619.1 iron complex outermembrane recepter protein [Chitinophaga terrae (ex Kim and Jung 2007)]
MSRFLFLLTALFCTAAAYAQNGTITGTVTTSDGQPAINVTISIEHTKLGGISNEKGEYSIKNIKPGNWTLRITSVGAATQLKQVTVSSGQVQELNFTLNESAAQLNEITISSRQMNKEDKSVAKMPLKNLENPQVYTTVSAELMKQQGITNYDDIMRNVPGLSQTWQSTGREGDGASYFALRGFEAQPVLMNGLPGLTSGNLDPSDIESVQVMKGPSGTLFGGSFLSYGGIINTITKKPYYGFGGEVAYNIGSFGLNRVTADVNTLLSKKQKIAMRLNAAYTTENSFQNAGFRKSFFVAPSVSYEVNNRLTLQVMAEILEEKRAVPPVFFHNNRSAPLDFKNIEELNLNVKESFTSNDLTIKNPRINVKAEALYKLSGNWSSQTVFSYGRTRSDGIYTYIWDEDPGNNWFGQDFHKENATTSTIDIQQNFNGDFKIGNLRNRLVAGLDFFRRNAVDKGSGWIIGRNVNPQGGVADVTDPETHEVIQPALPLTKDAIYGALAGTEGSNSNITNGYYSAYVSDVLNITPNFLVMASLRADYFHTKGDKNAKEDKGYNQFALSPKFGLVYQVVPEKVSVFASYMNAFLNVAPSPHYDTTGKLEYTAVFKPEHANQWELGVKADILAEKLYATVSVYDIKVGNKVIPDARNPRNSTQGGKVGSRGFEIELNAHPIPQLNIIAGYAYNHIEILEGYGTDFYSEPGRTPGGQGPSSLANFWATYKILGGTFKNLGIGAGGNYAGRYKVIDNSVTGVFYLPSYALLNAGLFYNAKHFRLSFNLNNINNKQYYTGYWSVNPQKPRNFVASAAFKF